jgi:hypothetical protein
MLVTRSEMNTVKVWTLDLATDGRQGDLASDVAHPKTDGEDGEEGTRHTSGRQRMTTVTQEVKDPELSTAL